jgi:hypothetical protein
MTLGGGQRRDDGCTFPGYDRPTAGATATTCATGPTSALPTRLYRPHPTTPHKHPPLEPSSKVSDGPTRHWPARTLTACRLMWRRDDAGQNSIAPSRSPRAGPGSRRAPRTPGCGMPDDDPLERLPPVRPLSPWRQLLQGPGITVWIAEGDEGAPGLHVDLADPHTASDEFSPGYLDIVDDHLDALL